MSELQLIETALRRAAQRRRWERAWHGLGRGLLAGAVLWMLALAAFKLFPVPGWLLPAAGVAGVTLALAGLVAGGWRKFSLAEAARWIDDRKHFEERLSTALEVSASSATGEWKNLLLTDAARHAQAVDPRQLLPFGLPLVMRWALLALALSAGLGFVPERRSQAHLRKQQETANIRDAGKHLAELTRQMLVERPPTLAPTEKAMTDTAELGDKFTKATLGRSEAMRDLASLTDKLGEQAKELVQNPALKPLEKAARESGNSGGASPDELQKQIATLQKNLGNGAATADKLDELQKNLQKLQQQASKMPGKDSPAGAAAREQMAQSLGDLARQAKEMGASLPGLEEAISALQANQTDLFLKDLDLAMSDLEKLKDMAKAMQQLQQQAAKLGKDLAEQLKNGQAQAAQQTLQKMLEQLKAGELSREQLQKLMDEVSKAVEPGSQYGKVGEHLKDASKNLQQGQKPDASQNLAAAAKELDKLMQQMQDAQSLQATLDALARAQMAIAMNKSWGECQAGPQGQGKGRGWGHGGKPGSGVGTWAEEDGWTYFNDDGIRWDNSNVQRPDLDPRGHTDRPDDVRDDLVPTKVRGQMSPGGSMPSITLKGVSIKGTSNVKFEEAATAAQTEAQNALNQDQVPRAYQNAVRDYFDDLKK